MEKKRSSFTGRVGFVLAAAGSAVGLGNLWRFPYLAAKYGGGIFLLVYIILAITFGFTLMVTEIAIGRKTGLSCISAYKKLDKRFGFMGWLSALVPVIIPPTTALSAAGSSDISPSSFRVTARILPQAPPISFRTLSE